MSELPNMPVTPVVPLPLEGDVMPPPTPPTGVLAGATLTTAGERYEASAGLVRDPVDYRCSVPGCGNTVSVRRYTGTVNGKQVCVKEVPQFAQFDGNAVNLYCSLESTDGTSLGWTQDTQNASPNTPIPYTGYPYYRDGSVNTESGRAWVFPGDDTGKAYVIMPLNENNVTPPFPDCTAPMPQPVEPAPVTDTQTIV